MKYLFALAILLAISPVALAQQNTAAAVPASEPVAAVSASEIMAQGMLDGRMAAQQHSTGGRFVGGFAAGFGLGLIGTGLVYALASGTPEVPLQQVMLIQDRPATYQTAYQEAYRRDIKSRRQSNALLGGLAGTAAIVTVIVAASN